MEGRTSSVNEIKELKSEEIKAFNKHSELETFLIFTDIKKLIALCRSQTAPEARQLFFKELEEKLDMYEKNTSRVSPFHFDVANKDKKHRKVLHLLLLEEQYDLIKRLLKYQSSKIDVSANFILLNQAMTTVGAYLANKNKPLALLIIQQNIKIQKQQENFREQNRIRAKITSAIYTDNVNELTTFLTRENIKPENVAERFQNPRQLVQTIAMHGAFETFKYFFELKPSLFNSAGNYISIIIQGCKNHPQKRQQFFLYLLEENRFSSLDPKLTKDHIFGALGVLNPDTCDQQDSHGITPLILAIESGYAISNNPAIFQILQKKDINAAIQAGDYKDLSLATIMLRTAIFNDSPILEDFYTFDNNLKINLFAKTSNHIFWGGFQIIYWLPYTAAFSERPRLLSIFASQLEIDPNLKVDINKTGVPPYNENLALSIAFCAESYGDAAFDILEKFIRENPVPVDPNATDNFKNSKFFGFSLAFYLALKQQYKILQILIEQNPDLIFDLDAYYKFNNNQCGLSFLNSLVNQKQWDQIDTFLKRYERAKELKMQKIPKINLNRKTNDKNSITIFESLIEEGQYDLARRLLAFHDGNIKPSILGVSNGVPIPEYLITLLMNDQLTFLSTFADLQEPIEVSEEVFLRLKTLTQYKNEFSLDSFSYRYTVPVSISQENRSITFKLDKITRKKIKQNSEATKTEAAKTLATLSESHDRKSKRNQKKSKQRAKKKAEQKAQQSNEQKPKAEEPEVYQPENQQTTSSTETKLDDKDKKEWITCLEHAFADAEQISIRWDDDNKLFIISLPKDEWTVIQHKAKENEVNKIRYQVKDQKFIEDQIIRIIKRHFDENRTAELTFDEQLWQVRVKPNSKKADLTTTQLHYEIATAFEDKIKKENKEREKKKKEEERLAKRNRKGKEESKPDSEANEDDKKDKGSSTQTTPSIDVKNDSQEVIFAEQLTPAEIKKIFKTICSYKLPNDMEFSLTKTEKKYQTVYSYSGRSIFALPGENNSIDYFNEGVIDSIDYFNALATALNTIIPNLVKVHAPQNNDPNNNNSDEVRIVVNFKNYSGKIINENLGQIKSIFASEIAKKISQRKPQQNALYLLPTSKIEQNPTSIKKEDSVTKQNLNFHLDSIEKIVPDTTKNQYEDINFWNYLLHGLCALTILQGKIRACNEDATEIDKLRNTFRHCCHEIEWQSFYMNLKPVIKDIRQFENLDIFTTSFFLRSIPAINNELKQFNDGENERYKNRTLGQGCEPLKQDFCLSLIEKFKHEEKDYTKRRNAILMLCSIIGKNQSHGEFHEIYTALHQIERPFDELADELYEKYFDYDAMHQKNLTFAGG